MFVAIIVVFAAELWLSGVGAVMGIPPEVAMLFGANMSAGPIESARVSPLLASAFVHFSILHLGFNAMALRNVMPFVERVVGTGRTAGLYVLTAAFASTCSVLVATLTGPRISAGASGAICGVIAAAMVIGLRTRGRQSPIVKSLGRTLIFVLLIGLLPGVDNAAHVGGMISGAAIALFWRRGPESGTSRGLWLALAITLLAGALVGTGAFAYAALEEIGIDRGVSLTGAHREITGSWRRRPTWPLRSRSRSPAPAKRPPPCA